jgi:hypothetical protein
MKPKVYVETSVIGYLTSWPSGDLIVAARQKITRDWWRDAPARYELMVSERVVVEASAGDAQAAKDRLDTIQALPRLAVTTQADNLAKALVAQGVVPAKYPEDALQVALASVNAIEYLVTWNFKHIANAELRQKIGEICAAAGYAVSIICSPEELLGT